MSAVCRTFGVNLLEGLPSVFSRLASLGARRNGESGRYQDPQMAESFGDESVHEVLSQLHAETFALWMSFTEDQQQKDLTWHMQWEERSLLDMVHLINSPQCAQLAPATIGNLEPFLRRLAILVLLISAEQEAQTNAAS